MPLFVPKPGLLRPATAGAAPDRVPDRRAAGTPEEPRSDLVALLGAEKVLAGQQKPDNPEQKLHLLAPTSRHRH